jgi:hypothetical protein
MVLLKVIVEFLEAFIVFGWFRRKGRAASGKPTMASQPPGRIFPWPKGAVLTAIDELVLALPMALFEDDRPMSEFVFGPDDMQINIPPEGETFFIRLMPQMSVSLAKPCQSYVVADDEDDRKPRRIMVTQTSKNA